MKEEALKNHQPEGRRHEDDKEKEVHGTVLHYLLNPRGEVDGLLFEGGTFIKFPPHLAFLGSHNLPWVRAAHADRLATWEAWESVSNSAQGKLK